MKRLAASKNRKLRYKEQEVTYKYERDKRGEQVELGYLAYDADALSQSAASS